MLKGVSIYTFNLGDSAMTLDELKYLRKWDDVGFMAK